MNLFRRIGKFFGEVRSEIKKVSWTKRSELIALTFMVIIIVVLAAIFIGIIDRMLSEVVGLMMEN
ncbi:preprotein translocase subunit SecE [candidate division NPL-UPA2 bacterium Unc8]|uniref:Protein translocase subunit SecE n=1 Tax=candidate division NPL-UPA2 bacterium Unc8 TaxID=1980939 RepID=A0A399FVT7_UNCN2|nr:MAG: preprotein translocase subunit SecE [candidate division NPL-UPA2 bacterium Unc8]